MRQSLSWMKQLHIKNGSFYDLSGKVGSIFQNPRTQFFTVDTTSEIAFGCENLAIDAEQIEQRICTTVDELKIQKLLGRSLFALSGGEKQKIACASVSAMEPEIFVLDEPSSNLDIAAFGELKKILKQWKAQGKTIVIAEHRLYYLMDIADRVIYMDKGSIVENLSIEEFRKKTPEELMNQGLRSLEIPRFASVSNQCKAEDAMCIKEFEVIYRDASCIYGKRTGKME